MSIFLQAQTTKQAINQTIKPEFKGYIDSFLAKTIPKKDEVQDSLLFELYVYLHTHTQHEQEEIQTMQYVLDKVLKYNSPNITASAYMNLAYSYRLTNHAENLLKVEWAVMQAYQLQETRRPCKALSYQNWLQTVRCDDNYKQYEQAQMVLKENFKKALQLNCIDEGISILNTISHSVFEQQKKYTEALTYKFKALKICDSLKISPLKKITIIHEIGLLHYKSGNYQEARSFWQQELGILEKFVVRNKEFVHTLNNIGLSHRKEKNYDSAIYYFDKTVMKSILQNDTLMIGVARGNIGICLVEQRKYPQALPYLKDDFKQSTNYKEWSNACITNLHIAKVYIEQQEYQKALHTLDTTKQILISRHVAIVRDNEIYPLRIMMIFAEHKASVYQALKQLDSAYYYKNLQLNYTDSMQKVSKTEELLRQQGNYEVMQQELKTKVVMQEKEIQKKMLIAAFIIIVLSIILLIMLFFYNKNRIKKLFLEKENLFLQAKNEETKKIFVETALNLEIEKRQQADAQSQHQEEIRILELQQKEQELTAKHRELSMLTLLVSNKNEILEQILAKLKEVDITEDNFPKLKEIKSEILQNFRHETEWEQFKLSFERTHTKFYENILAKHPKLSKTELQHCAFMRMRMSSKQVSDLLVQSKRTSDTIRYRLKKEFGLGAEDDLVDYMQQF